jgi:integrase
LGRRYFKKIAEKIGLDKSVALYALRHTCATLLLSANVNPKIVSERLGHASIALTLDTYSHVLPGMQESATETLTEVLYS